MSSAISGAGQGLYQFFQSISKTNASSPTAATSATSATTATGSTSSSDASQDVAQAGGHHHHHGGGHGGLFKEIQSAVTNALQSSQADPTADPNKTIEDAIAKVLQNAQGGASASGSATQTGTGTAVQTDPTTSGSSTDSASSTQQTFAQLLKSFGVDPQQFRQDFLSALKDAQNGNVNSQTALQSFPPGSNVDVTG